MTPEQLVDAILQTQHGYCDWTKHGTRADDGRYKTECGKCMTKARQDAIVIATRAMENADNSAG